jgi:Domain of unknown function (DUF4381)
VIVTPWLILLLAPSADAGYTYPPERRGDMVASLNVEVLEGGPALVDYTLTVTGGPHLQIEAPELVDATGAWTARRSSAWAYADGQVTWTEFIRLDQVKPGIVPLPDVRVRFRAETSADWQQAEWKDILKDLRELPLPAVRSAPPSNWSLPLIAVGAACLVALLVAAGTLIRRRRRLGPVLSVEQRALRELDRLENASGAPEWRFARLADVLRGYLSERFGVPALQQTTSEFLRETSDALAGERDVLRELLEHCDLAKFAGVAADGDQWKQSAARARAFIRRTARTPDRSGYPSHANSAEQAPPRT